MRNTIAAILFLVLLTAGGPIQPKPHDAPGGFIFTPAPAAVDVYRDTLLIATISEGDTTSHTQWLVLDEETVLVSFADPEIPELGRGVYEYRLLGHFGRLRRGPYAETKSGLPEATLTIEKGQMCVQRASSRRCEKR